MSRCGLEPERYLTAKISSQSPTSIVRPPLVPWERRSASPASRWLRQIGVTIRNYEREHTAERSMNHGEQSDLPRNGDYLIPNLTLSEQPSKPLGKYGRMRKAYLKEHRPLIYNQLLMSEKLYLHLLEIDETANSRLEQMMPRLAKEAGATEELKARDPMKWVGLMNTCKAQAEEILMAELINS